MIVSAGTAGSLRPTFRLHGDLGRVEEGLQDILRSSRAPACQSGRARRQAAAATRRAAADGLRHRRCRQARIVRHPLQPVGNRPPHPGIAGDGSQHARPCGRSPGDDRRRSARGSRRTASRRRPPPRRSNRAKKRRARRCRRRSPRRRPMCRAPAPQAFAPQPKPELPNPAARRQEHFAAAPREFHAAQPVAPPIAAPMPPRAISEILEPHAAAPRTAIAPELPPDHPLEPGTRPAGADVVAVGAHRRFRKRDQRNRRSRQGAGQFVELHRRRAPRRAGRRRRAAQREGRDGRCEGRRQGRVQGRGDKSKAGDKDALEHHLQDPLAAGRRERGRDRARHLQDGDDAARHRQRAANAADGKFGRAGRPGAGARGEQRQARDAGARRALDDLADPDRPAIEQFTPAPNTLDSAQVAIPAGRGVADHCQRHHRRDPDGCRPPAPSSR